VQRADLPIRRRAPREPSTIGRVVVAVPWAVFAVVIILAGGTVFAVAVIGLGVLALHELYRMLRQARPIPLAGFLGMAGLILAAEYGDQFQMVLLSALSVLVTFLLALARPNRRNITVAMAATLLGVFWVGLALSHAVLLRELSHGGGLLADTLIATFLGDTGAYFGGRFWGARPLAPRISPSKTLEGLGVGFVTGTLAFWFAGLYQDWLAGTDALVIGACVAAVAPLGDLFESLVKRDLGVKDTSRVFGDHGGVLDRLDAAFFTVVVAYYVARAVI
jgi:phosphatidate cytidylyltransferase